MALQVEVVSADSRVWSGEARTVVVRTVEGDLGVLPGHVPTVAMLVPGEVRIQPASGDAVRARVEGGFLSVEHDRVTVVCEAAALVEPATR